MFSLWVHAFAYDKAHVLIWINSFKDVSLHDGASSAPLFLLVLNYSHFCQKLKSTSISLRFSMVNDFEGKLSGKRLTAIPSNDKAVKYYSLLSKW